MTKIDRFMAAVMGIPDVNRVHCSLCENRMYAKQYLFCGDCWKTPMLPRFELHQSLKKYVCWTPDLNNPDFRKWFQEHEPEVWNNYLCHEHSFLFPQDDFDWYDILEAQLSIQNFYNYLIAHWDEWGDIDEYTPEGKSRRICKYPAAEKILREEG